MTEDFEKIFNQDVSEKKRIARGANAKASTRKGFKGNVRFPNDHISASDKKILLDNEGRVRKYNMKTGKPDKPIDYSDLKAIKDKDMKLNTLQGYLDYYGRAELAEMWGINPKTIADLLYRLLDKPSLRKHTPEFNISYDELMALPSPDRMGWFNEALSKYTVSQIARGLNTTPPNISRLKIEYLGRNPGLVVDTAEPATSPPDNVEINVEMNIAMNLEAPVLNQEGTSTEGVRIMDTNYRVQFGGRLPGEIIKKTLRHLLDTINDEVIYELEFNAITVKEECQD